MDEGWHDSQYLILFTEAEIPLVSERYGIAATLRGFQLLGLRGWDDFIVRDAAGGVFTVPSVPCISQHLAPFRMPPRGAILARDERFVGRIRWYVKPIVFGGDPSRGENLMWVSHDQHVQLVRWWNEQYRSLTANRGGN